MDASDIIKKPLILKEEIIPDLIGKPFNDPFEIFIFSKKNKILKIQKYDKNIIEKNNLDDYGISSSYCNGNNYLFISGGENKNLEISGNFWKINLETLKIDSINMNPKKDHSMLFIPGNYVFIVGGNDLKTFYYSIENKEFNSWCDINKKRFEPSLALISNYLYCFDNINTKNNNKNMIFEKTDITSGYPQWEIINPIVHTSLDYRKLNQNYFGVAKIDDNNIIFIGGSMDGDENENKFNFKYNINMNTIEASELPFKEYILKEKTFLTYNHNIDYILPDFNRLHPEVIFYQKNKNKLNLIKYYPNKDNKQNKLQNPPKPLIEYKFNLNMPDISHQNVDNIINKEDNKENKENIIIKINESKLDIKEPLLPEININNDINNANKQNHSFEPPNIDPYNPDPKISLNIPTLANESKNGIKINYKIDNENNIENKIQLNNNENKYLTNEGNVNIYNNKDNFIISDDNNNLNKINKQNDMISPKNNQQVILYSPEMNHKNNNSNDQRFINSPKIDINAHNINQNSKEKKINLNSKNQEINFKGENNNNRKQIHLKNNNKQNNLKINPPKKEDLNQVKLKMDINWVGTISGKKTPNMNYNTNYNNPNYKIDFTKDINISGVIKGQKKEINRNRNHNNNIMNKDLISKNNEAKVQRINNPNQNNHLSSDMNKKINLNNKIKMNNNNNNNNNIKNKIELEKPKFAFDTSNPENINMPRGKSNLNNNINNEQNININKPKNDIIKNIPPLKIDNCKNEFSFKNCNLKGNLSGIEVDATQLNNNNLDYYKNEKNISDMGVPKQNNNNKNTNSVNDIKNSVHDFCRIGIIPGIKKKYNTINIQKNEMNLHQAKTIEENFNDNNKEVIKQDIKYDNLGKNNISEDNNTNKLANSGISDIKKKGKELPLVGQKNNNFQPSKIENAGNLDVNVNVKIDDLKYTNAGENEHRENY